jgi:glucose-1-phosphate adenylyltransferase
VAARGSAYHGGAMKIEGTQSLRIVAMVLAGGRVGELSVLTMQRPKAALPFAGYFRIIDFALSNLMRAGISRVGILSQYRPASLIEHVGTGESWDFVGLDRSAKILPPFWGGEAGDWYQGNADAVDQNWNFLADVSADLVLVLSGDHIYRTDYRDLIQSHLSSGADFTVAVKKMPHDPHYGYARLDSDQRVLGYTEKPGAPSDDHASLTIYLASTRALREVFDSEPGRRGELLEFGKDVIPYMLDRYHVRGHVFADYWAYTRTIPMYYEAHQDLLRGRIDLDAWGVRTNLQDTLVASQPPARFGPHAEVNGSLVSTGCEIDGEVIRSVLSPGVRVERGARVVDSILCHNTRVHAGAVVQRTISDKHVSIGPDTHCGSDMESGAPARISLIGKHGRLGCGCRLAPGATVLPGGQVTDRETLGARS